VSDNALRALAAADPRRSVHPRASDDALLRAILATPRPARRRPRRTILVLAIGALALGATGAYAALSHMDAAKVDAVLAHAAANARPLTASEIAAIERDKAADGALYRCLETHGAPLDASGGLNPSSAVKAACAAEQRADDASHADPAVRAAFGAEAVLIDAAWYCVQQRGYAVNADRRTSPPAGTELAAIWRTFASCEAEVGVPPADRARTP
jgi:hypothetical protein